MGRSHIARGTNRGLLISKETKNRDVQISSKQKGPGEEGAPRKWPISSADFPMTPMERTEHHFGPFWEKDFGAISGDPASPGPLDQRIFQPFPAEATTPQPWIGHPKCGHSQHTMSNIGTSNECY